MTKPPAPTAPETAALLQMCDDLAPLILAHKAAIEHYGERRGSLVDTGIPLIRALDKHGGEHAVLLRLIETARAIEADRAAVRERALEEATEELSVLAHNWRCNRVSDPDWDVGVADGIAKALDAVRSLKKG